MRRRRNSGAGFGVLVMIGCHAPPRAPVHHACPTGPVVLAGQDDVDAMRGCERVEALAIRTGMALDLAPLDKLATIEGDLAIGPSVGLDEVKLVGLVTVGDVKIASNNLMVGAYFPRLAHAKSVIVDGNAALATLSLPELVGVDGEFRVTDDGALELVEASRLQTIGGALTITGVPELALAEFGALASAAQVTIVAPKATDVERLRALGPASAPAPQKAQ